MDDLISRQAAIEARKNRWKKTRNYEGIGDDIAEECELYLKQVPSAQPEPKEGHWIEVGIYRDVIECNCSECGQLMTTAATVRMNFCPNCGAKMKGAEHETN